MGRPRALLRRVLEVRFGELSPELLERLDSAGPDVLERLAVRAVTVDAIDDLLSD